MKSRSRRRLALTLLLCLPAQEALATDARDLETPPPVSGRRLSDPSSILPADVLARVELLRANVELIRRFVGRPSAPSPLLRVEHAQPREVYSQALNLEARANRLAFEQLRVVRASSLPNEKAGPIDVFGVVDSALASVLLVKAELGIVEAVAEQPRPESTTPSEVFNASVAAGNDINNVLQQRTSPSDVFQLVTQAVHHAAALHTTLPSKAKLPSEPDFAPNKMPSEVYQRLLECFALTAAISTEAGIETLDFQPGEDATRLVTPNDVASMASLLVEELSYLQSHVARATAPTRAYHPGLRFPAHVYQRAGLLREILEDLVGQGLAESGG